MATKKKRRAPRGSGSVFRRSGDGLWVFRVRVGTRPDGKPEYLWRAFQTRDEAREAREEYHKNKETFKSGRVKPPILRDYAEKCLAIMSVADSTRKGYQSYLTKHVAPSSLGGMRIDEIRKSDAQAFINGLVGKKKVLHNKPGHYIGILSNKTIREVGNFLSSVFRLAIEDCWINDNPMKNVSLPVKERPRPVPIEPSQLAEFWPKVAGHRDFVAYVLDATTGVRRGELLGFCWDAIDLETGKYRVFRQIAWRGGKWALTNPSGTDPEHALKSSNGYGRTGFLSPIVIQLLKSYKKEQMKTRLRVGKYWEDNNLVFCTETGGIRNPDSFGKTFQRMARQAGLQADVCLKALRHAVATTAIRSDVDDATIAALLGHNSANFTREFYYDYYESEKKDVASLMSNSIGLDSIDAAP